MNTPLLTNLLLTAMSGQLMPGQPNQQPTMQINSRLTSSLSRDSLEELSRIICDQYPNLSDCTSLFDNILDNISPGSGTPRSTGFSNSQTPYVSRSNAISSPLSVRVQTQQPIVLSFLEKLKSIPNALETTIQQVFNPRKFQYHPEELKALLNKFNSALTYDGWKVFIQQDGSIGFMEAKPDISIFDETDIAASPLENDFAALSFDGLSRNAELTNILRIRLEELRKSLDKEAPIASIILAGSILEGVLRGLAEDYPRIFNTVATAPRDSAGILPFRKWSLANFIDAAAAAGFLNKGTQEFNHTLRDFRNYIHPYEQMSHHFDPDMATARLCFQAMKESVWHIRQHLKTLSDSPSHVP